MRKARYRSALGVLASVMGGIAVAADDLAVNITPTLSGVSVVHAGKAVRIQRNQDQSATVSPYFERTSRPCPPFCIQPMHMPDGVETIGEIEMLDYLQRIARGDHSIMVIDSRGADWLQRGTIPGSVNIHYKRLSLRASDEAEVAKILTEQFDVERSAGEKFWDFRFAKTLVLFCNGAWCGQSPSNIRALLSLGYPASKLKWYRGGMQAWELAGLTSVAPE